MTTTNYSYTPAGDWKQTSKKTSENGTDLIDVPNEVKTKLNNLKNYVTDKAPAHDLVIEISVSIDHGDGYTGILNARQGSDHIQYRFNSKLDDNLPQLE